MSGETGNNESGWTVDTARADLLARIGALERLLVETDRHQQELTSSLTERLDQRFAAYQHEVTALFDASAAAVTAALTASKEAISKSESSAEKRFDSVNEFRAQLSDQASTFMPRREAEQRMEANREKTDNLELRMLEMTRLMSSRLDQAEGRSRGLNDGWGYLVGGFAFLATIIGIATTLLLMAN